MTDENMVGLSPQNIALEKIRPLPGLEEDKQPDKAYGSLVSSILINGVKEPLLLRPMEGGEYQLVSGYRRLRACRLAKLKEIPALVYDMTEQEALDYRAKAAQQPDTPIPGKPVQEEKAADIQERKRLEEPEGKAPKETKAKKPKTQAKAPGGPAAEGPAGTAITKILDNRLTPPGEKEKKSFQAPGEREAFSVMLHPGYLKKAEINSFSVDREADDFKELYRSIERFGVKEPVLARVGADGELEILSGQRRHLIASELNYPVPTIIQQLDDDDARILVADGNLHREHISTYDQARALRMKADSMKRKAGRRSKGSKSAAYTDELLASEMGMNVSKLNRLMKLSEASPRVCEMVDEGSLALSIAYNIAFLSPEIQDMVVDLADINVKLSSENTNRLKEVSRGEKLDYDKVRDVLEGRYPLSMESKTEPPVEKSEAAATPAPKEDAAPLSIPSAPVTVPESPDVTETARPEPTAPEAANQTEETSMPSAVDPREAAPKALEAQDRESSYTTRIVLTGDRLRKYFPDVSMTPREIEDSVYEALEERRQRQEKLKQKEEHKFSR